MATLEATLLAAVDPVASQVGRTKTGGRLDVCKALPACSGVALPPPLPPPHPTTGDFSIGASPARQAVPRGVSATYTVTVTPSGGFTGLVALTVTGVPTDGSGSFAPTPLSVTSSTPSSSTPVTTSATTPPASYKAHDHGHERKPDAHVVRRPAREEEVKGTGAPRGTPVPFFRYRMAGIPGESPPSLALRG